MKYYLAVVSILGIFILGFVTFGLSERLKSMERKMYDIQSQCQKIQEENDRNHRLMQTDIDIIMYGYEKGIE